MSIPRTSYRPAWWIPGAHLKTMWGKLARRRPQVALRVERWEVPDGDFLDLHRLAARDDGPSVPRVLMLHGLEGSPDSHYARGMLQQARLRGWAADALVFRSCGAEPNRLARSYHSGETTDLDFVVRRLIEAEPDRLLLLAGVSLGGNVLLKWLGERGDDVPSAVRAAAAVSVPYDLARSARRIDRGFSKVYQANFLRTLRRKAHAKRERFPGILDAELIDRARSFYDFDDCVTARLHGFTGADDYYARSSSLGFLPRIRVPTLLLSAVDDPFLPSEVLDDVRAIARDNSNLCIEFPKRGGHVGFISGLVPWKPDYYAERRIMEFLAESMRDEGAPLRAG
ncbi:MAG: hydrolase [Gemmatimonadota bacterium]|nr:hydrolase [Gemmatimonadota bacterium]